MVVETDERRVLALVRVGRAMSSTADYEQALATLIQTISELLDAESAGFMLYDPERSELVLQQPAFGIDDPEKIAAYHVSLREGGNAVRVFLSRSPYMSNDAGRDPAIDPVGFGDAGTTDTDARAAHAAARAAATGCRHRDANMHDR